MMPDVSEQEVMARIYRSTTEATKSDPEAAVRGTLGISVIPENRA